MRTLPLALATLSLVALNGCSCSGNGGNDGGSDGGLDGGPLRCMGTADCADAGRTEQVCDPQDKICRSKCVTDSDCTYVSDGVCEKLDGTCRSKCNGPGGDYCPDTFMNKVCNDDKGTCMDRCFQDEDCSSLRPGTACQETTGKCNRPVHGCNIDTDCNSFIEFDDYCFNGGIQCFCAMQANDAGTSGVCHRRNRSCTECQNDQQCGSAPHFEPQGACMTVAGDTKKYCLFRHAGPCPCGYFDNGNGFCAPAQGRTCADPGCVADKDCPGGSVCETSRCACEPRCRWDFQAKAVAAPGCRPGQTCWVDNENLDPTSVYYGAGRCKPPCNNDGDCMFNSTTNPHGGTKLKCAAEQLQGGGLDSKRCRANGECMDDLECPIQPETSIYYGYCDRGSFTCKLDCRTGNDPVTGKPYDDCRPPYACRNEGGMNKCVLKTCVEQGGTSIACSTGEYCCGEDKNFNDAGDPCPPAGDRDPAGCYRAPLPPICKKCEIFCQQGGGCQVMKGCNDPVPNWLASGPDHCTNGSLSPSCAQRPDGTAMPNVCNIYNQEMAAGGSLFHGYCEAATHNDVRSNAIGRTNANVGCPANFGVRFDPVVDQPLSPNYVAASPNDNDEYCDTDADCQKGNDAGRCAPSMGVPRKMDGTPRKACLCNVGSTRQQCPNQADAGVVSFCRDGLPGSEQFCVGAVVCNSPRPFIFAEVDGGFLSGCGIKPLPP